MPIVAGRDQANLFFRMALLAAMQNGPPSLRLKAAFTSISRIKFPIRRRT